MSDFTLTSEDPHAPAEKPIFEPARLEIEHPFKDLQWNVIKVLPERGCFILQCASNGRTLELHEDYFELK